jgi:hypothetical protein
VIAIGRSNWLFAGSLRAGKRAAAVMSLIRSAKLNGHDPYAYLKDVLTRLPTQRASQIGHCCRTDGKRHHSFGLIESHNRLAAVNMGLPDAYFALAAGAGQAGPV